MKKKHVLMSSLVVLLLFLCTPLILLAEEIPNDADVEMIVSDDYEITPYWAYLVSSSVSLDFDGRTASFSGDAYGDRNYKYHVAVYLQKYIGGNSWSELSGGFKTSEALYGYNATGGSKPVASAGTYRTACYITVYNSSGQVVETTTTYSSNRTCS